MSKLFNWVDGLSKEKEHKDKIKSSSADFMMHFNKEFCAYCTEVKIYKPNISDVIKFLQYCGFDSKYCLHNTTLSKNGVYVCIDKNKSRIDIFTNNIHIVLESINEFLTDEFIEENNLLFKE